jgi:hypothetical protein
LHDSPTKRGAQAAHVIEKRDVSVMQMKERAILDGGRFGVSDEPWLQNAWEAED